MSKNHRRHHFARTILFGACALACQTPLHADQFLFKDGRVITGKIVSQKTIQIANPDRKSAPTDEEMIVEIEPDVQVAIRKSELKVNGHVPSDKRREEYESRAAKAKDTVESQFELLEFCAKNSLADLVEAHYLRILDLDADNARARSGIKHVSNNTGTWERVEDRMRRLGKSYVKGKWVYPELVQENEQQEEYDKRRKELLKELNNKQKDISTIDDPLLAEVIADKLVDKTGNTTKIQDQLKIYYIAQLGRLENPYAGRALGICAMDNNPPVRNAALDVLSKSEKLRMASLGYLITGLKSPDNDRVNFAGYALGKLEASEAILPLIIALVTKHTTQVQQNNNYNPDSFTTGGPKTQTVEAKNEQVRNALAQITGQGALGYDRSAWIAWYARIHAKPVDDLRRDL